MEKPAQRDNAFTKWSPISFMHQYVDEGTQTSGNILVLIHCDADGLVENVNKAGKLSKRDHETITFSNRMVSG